MTTWEFFGSLFRDILIVYYFGSPVLFYSATVLAFLVWMLSTGLSVQQAILFTLPLAAVFAANGAFGTNLWVTNVFLLVIAIIYGVAILDIFT